MFEERFDERTEPATPRRRQEARARGHVAKSADLATAVVLLGGLTALAVCGRSLAAGLFDLVRGSLGSLAAAGEEPGALASSARAAAGAGLGAALPVVGALLLVAVAAHGAQVGFLFAWPAVAPDAARLDPARGWARIFSGRTLARGAASLLKVIAVSAVAGATLWSERERLVGLGGASAQELARVWAGTAGILGVRMGLALLALGLADYAVARWLYERELRMSRAERLEEQRRTEGDPELKKRRLALGRRIAPRAGPADRPLRGAAVLVVDSDGAAVALGYDPSRDPAPRVVAKAAGRAAERLREEALGAGVPVVERAAARALFRRVPEGRPVPGEAFPEVAEILAFVVRLKSGTRAS